MKNARKKLLILSAVLIVTLLCLVLSISSFAAEGENVWTFSQSSVGDPIYVKNHFDTLPERTRLRSTSLTERIAMHHRL